MTWSHSTIANFETEQTSLDVRSRKFQSSITVRFIKTQFLMGHSFPGSLLQRKNGEKENNKKKIPALGKKEEKWQDHEWATAQRAYRTLKFAMEAVRAWEEEARFYALEQNCRRARTDTHWSVRLASNLYYHLSDYGQSFLRPLQWLAGIPFGVFLLIYVEVSGFLVKWDAFNFWKLVDFTLAQLVRPFIVWLPSSQENLHTLFGQNAILLFFIKFIASLQSLFSLSLLALFFLALRQNFKRGQASHTGFNEKLLSIGYILTTPPDKAAIPLLTPLKLHSCSDTIYTTPPCVSYTYRRRHDLCA